MITDDEELAAIDAYLEGREMETAGKKLKQTAQKRLVGVEGVGNGYQVRWTQVGPADIPANTRNGYARLDVRVVRR